MDVLSILLIFYVGILLINSIFNGYLWYSYRHKLFKYSFCLWIFTTLNFLAQSLFQEHHYLMVLSFSTYFISSIYLSLILRKPFNEEVPIKSYVIIYLFTHLFSLLAWLSDMSFLTIALPVSIGVVTPMLHSCYMFVIDKKKRAFSQEASIVTFIVFINALHFLDYPFLRLDQSAAIFGYSFAIILIFSFSIFIPSFLIRMISLQHNVELTHEIESRKVVETSLIEAVKEIHIAQNAKNNFLANMSHEMRTPLNGIIGMSSLLKETNLSNEQKDYLATIISSGEHLNRSIENILDYVKLNRNHDEDNSIRFSMNEIESSLVNYFHTQDIDHEVIFRTNVNQSIPKVLFGDQLKIERILLNLLDNAIKFSEKGTITFSCLLEKKTNDHCYLYLSVEDEGKGIDDEQKNKIFELFNQEDNTATRTFGGLGLGLTIAQTYAHSLGTKISVKSDQDHGSLFFFELVIPYVNIDQIINNDDIDLNTIMVLIAEDDLDNQLLLKNIFTKSSIHFDICSDGLQAFNLYKDKNYDLLITDINMPVQDGIETIKQIRKYEVDFKRKKLPIMALTARALESDKAEILDSGADSYITKPVSSKKLISELKKTLKSSIEI